VFFALRGTMPHVINLTKQPAPKPPTSARIVPNRGMELQYRRALQKLTRQMQKDINEKLLTAYKKQLLKIAQDATPKQTLIHDFSEIRAKWYKKYTQLSRNISAWFVIGTQKRTQKQISAKLAEAVFTVQMQMSAATKALMSAQIEANAVAITKLPQVYAQKAQKVVMEALERGRDLQYLENELKEMGTVMEGREALVARDQIDRVTQQLAISEAQGVGASKGRWLHVPGLRSSRETHEQFDGQVFDLSQGLYDEEVGEFVVPGELIYCACQFEIVLPGYER